MEGLKRFSILLFVVLMSLSLSTGFLCDGGGDGEKNYNYLYILIINDSFFSTIEELYIKESISGDWGSDILSALDVEPGYYLLLWHDVESTYDVRIIDDTPITEYVYSQSLSKGQILVILWDDSGIYAYGIDNVSNWEDFLEGAMPEKSYQDLIPSQSKFFIRKSPIIE